MYIEKKKLDDTHNILLSGCVITGINIYNYISNCIKRNKIILCINR